MFRRREMSRCFAYPPSGYVQIRGRGGEGSVEPTKLQKEKTEVDTERIKERKGHKEKRELLKKRRDAYVCKVGRLGDEKSHCYEKTDTPAALGSLSDDSSISGLSEEHSQPVPSSLFNRSNETDSNKKRKLDVPSPSTAESAGKKIRIRFTFRRQSESQGKEPVLCSTSTSGDADPVGQPTYQVINAHVQEPSSSSCSLKFKIGKKYVPAECKEEVPSVESTYRALIEEWAAPSISAAREDPDDQEWLFGTKPQDTKAHGRLQTVTNKDASCPTIGDLWPRAHYLPDAEIFALPYTVPF